MGFERRGWKTLVSGFPGYRQQYGYGGGGDVQTKSSGGGGGVCVPELWGHQLIEHKLTALHLLMSSLPNCYVSFCFHLYVKKQCDAVK